MRPVLKGMCQIESLINGTIDLALVALMNEALDVQAENDRRLHARAVEKARAR